MHFSGCSFIITVIEPRVNLPFEIIPGHFLKKADQTQVKLIKEILEAANWASYSNFHSPYEFDQIIIPGKAAGSLTYKYKRIAAKDYRYWIITWEGSNHEMQELEYSFSLIKHEFEFGLSLLVNEDEPEGANTGWGFEPHSLFTHLYDHNRNEYSPKKLFKYDLKNAAKYYKSMKTVLPNYVHIKRAIQRYNKLRALPITSELMTIGLFSVIETLLTHDPDPKDPTDSLSRQIKSKIPLLRRRANCSIDHERYFDNINESTLWTKLYSFRSKIVHGGSVDFSREFSALKDEVNIYWFLKETIKLLIIEALAEPDLLTDLKIC